MKAKKAEETVKTNVMRLLEAAGISFETGTYEVDENDLSGSHAADLMGVDHDTMYKTLVLKGEKKGYTYPRKTVRKDRLEFLPLRTNLYRRWCA